MKTKPAKPYRDFPLTAHPNGQWCKKVRGALRYFGPWDDWQGALNLFLEQKDDLYAGRTPRSRDGVTLGEALDRFLSSKKLLEQGEEISTRSYLDYEGTCDRIASSLDTDRLLSDVGIAELEQLRADLSKGKRGQFGPITLKNQLTRARSFFLYANEYLAEKPIPYRKPLRSPSRKQIRQVANRLGPRMFERVEVQAMIEAADLQLRAMICLGINCGFGNHDCGTLPFEVLDLERGWHGYWRPKTHNPRRCPLWPETVTALREAIAARPQDAGPETAGLVFVTRFGLCWSKNDGDNPLSFQMRKLLTRLGIYRKNVTTFYSLRRTFETIGQTAGDQVAVDYIMGHIAPSDDMAAVYRQKTFDSQLLKVTNHVRAWLAGDLNIE